jgi:hypothetical protein
LFDHVRRVQALLDGRLCDAWDELTVRLLRGCEITSDEHFGPAGERKVGLDEHASGTIKGHAE